MVLVESRPATTLAFSAMIAFQMIVLVH